MYFLGGIVKMCGLIKLIFVIVIVILVNHRQ